jgi:hypothetical protein
MPTTSWSDEEYGAVAKALLYPGSRVAAVVVGYSGAVPIAWQLDGRLQQLDPATKADALTLARQIQAGEDALLAGALGGCGSNRGAVLQVGDIRLDPRLGRTEREALLDRARERLAALVDFCVNPDRPSLGGGGGVQGRWSR